ncbi:hypothetical protein [Bdellovibrio sp. GT3]|uniref:hypothetical protein n=1 Tax=Bdellovibrio sp. GT3 TaxID=3136282 RepID=UPI0030F0C85A
MSTIKFVYDPQWASCHELIYSVAHKTGIPVPMIKAQMEQETGFSFKKKEKSILKKDYYRYEPVFDRTYFYGMSSRVNYADAYTNAPAYKPWLYFLTSNKVYTKLLHLRSKYKVGIDGKYVAVPDNYEKRTKTYSPLRAWDLVDADINHLGDSQRWFDTKTTDAGVVVYTPAPTLANFNFVAQTTVSASYGMMQVMYPTAVGQGFTVNGVGDDPWKLFRPSVGLELGAKHMLAKYKAANTSRNTSTMISLDYYMTNLRLGYVRYNGSPKNARARDYGVNVLKRSDQYFTVEKIVYAR